MEQPNNLQDIIAKGENGKEICFTLLNCSLVLNNIKLKIKEVEYYYTSPTHPDPYPHQTEEQLQNNTFYLHKTGKNYREGTYRGIDITCGNGKNYGGILIRSLQKDNGEIICGPCCCVDELIRIVKLTTAKEFSNHLGKNIFDTTKLHLISNDKINKDIGSSIRVGLNLNKKVEVKIQLEYLMKNYRYFDDAVKLSKGKTQSILQLIKENKSEKEITSKYGRKVKTVMENINKGKNTKLENYIGIKLDDNMLAMLFGCIN